MPVAFAKMKRSSIGCAGEIKKVALLDCEKRRLHAWFDLFSPKTALA
jgi:hypothetical protein